MLKRFQISFACLALIGVVSGPVPLLASNDEPANTQPPVPMLSPDQLDALLAPIALYPDPLLAQILPASTQPGEIVMADRYVKAQKDPNQIASQSWDESVKALAHYPDVLSMMDKQLDWTTQLGEAFIAQPSDVYESVQRLRAKAEAVGNLKSTPQQVVTTEQNIIQIMPADPQVIYVPQYQPEVVYVQQPVNVVAPLITFGAGLALGIWIHNEVNWHGNNVYYHNNGWNGGYNGGYHGGGNNVTINNNNNININNGNGNVWKPQNKPSTLPAYKPGNGNGNGWNGNKPGNGNGNGWNGNGSGNGNKPSNGNGWNGNGNNRPGNGGAGNGSKPGNGNGWTGNKPGNGSGNKPSTLPGQTQKPNQGNQPKPTTRPAQPTQPAARPMPTPSSGKQQFNREATKPSQSRPAQATRPAPTTRQAPAGNRGGGREGGGRQR